MENECRKNVSIIIDLFSKICYAGLANEIAVQNLPLFVSEKPLERWSSGLRHTLGKRARLTASAGSNPVLSAKIRLAFESQQKRKHKIQCFLFLFLPFASPALMLREQDNEIM